MLNLHTHTLHTQVKCFVWGCKVFGLGWEGMKGGGRYRVDMNQMITLESLKIYFTTYFFIL